MSGVLMKELLPLAYLANFQLPFITFLFTDITFFIGKIIAHITFCDNCTLSYLPKKS